MPLIVTKGLGLHTSVATFAITTVTPTPTYVDLVFNADVAALTLSAASPSNWIITTTGAVPVTATSIQISASDTIRLGITEPRQGDSYSIFIPDNGLKSIGNLIYNGADHVDFTGVAVAPVAAQCQSLDARRLRVIYSEPVIAGDALTASNYSVLPPLSVYAVRQETESTYVLTTDPQTPGQTYTLTIVNVRDLSQNPV